MTNHRRLVSSLVVAAAVSILATGELLLRGRSGYANPTAPASGETVPGRAETLLPDGRWLRSGGRDARGFLRAVEVFDPLTGIVRAGSLSRARAWHTATLLGDGRVLIFGGMGRGGAVLGDAELFDPSTGASEMLATSLAARAYHSATLLLTGEVVVAGGVSTNGTALTSIDVWNPTGGTTAVALQLSAPRYGHTATLLPNGVVVFWGGFDGFGNSLVNGEVLDSEAGRLAPIDVFVPPVELMPPQVEASIPPDGAIEVDAERFIALRFSESLLVSSVNTTTVVLADSAGPVDAQVVPAEGGMLAFITPRTSLRPGTTYTVTVAGVFDDEGVVVAAKQLSFTTATSDGLAPSSGEADDESEDRKAGAGIRLPADLRDAPPARPWVPNERNLSGDWRIDLPRSPWQDLPPRRAQKGVTALTGQVLRLDGWPLAKVEIQVGRRRTRTDETGRFLLSKIKAGPQEFVINGRTASTPAAQFGEFTMPIDIPAKQTMVLPFTIWMPVLDTAHATPIPSPTTAHVVATTPLIPGLEVHIPRGVVFRDRDGAPVTSITITPFPVDRPPGPLPEFDSMPISFTLQPGGATIDRTTSIGGTAIRIVFPNYSSVPAGSQVDLWHMDAAQGWLKYGLARVGAYGRQIIPDPGAGLDVLTCIAMPPGGGGCPGSCCIGDCCASAAGGSGAGMGGGGIGGGGGWVPLYAGSRSGRGGCAGGGAYGGEPVHLATGLFVDRNTDLYLPDTLPLDLTRTYRANATISYAFGIGTTHPYDMFLAGDLPTSNSYTCTFVQLVLSDGARIRYDRQSGTSCDNAVFAAHTATPTVFYGSTLARNGGAPGAAKFRLTLNTGTLYDFTVRVSPVTAFVDTITDRYGNRITISRETQNRTVTQDRITKITSPHGRWIEFTYEPGFNRLTQAKDNTGRVVTYTYDLGRLSSVQDVDGGLTTYTYDGTSSRLRTIRTARQNDECPLPGCTQPPFLTNDYFTGGQKDGRVMRQTLADGSVFQFDYAFDGGGTTIQTDVIDRRGSLRRVTFNSNGYVLSETMAVGTAEEQTVTYTREPGPLANFVSTITDALVVPGTGNRRTTFTYDASTGAMLSSTRAAGTADELTTTFTYEPRFNQLASIQDAAGHVATFEYDPNDPRALLQSITDPTQRRTKVTFTPAGQLQSVSDPFLVAAPPPVLATTTFSYEAGDLVSVTDPEGFTTVRFVDAVGRVRGMRDPLGRVTRYTYDGFDRVRQVTDPGGGITTFEYDKAGNLTRVEDARQQVTNHKVTSYTYDELDRLQTRTDQLDRPPEVFAYDPSGNLKSYTDRRGKVADVMYDALDRRICAGYGRLGSEPSCTATSSHEDTISYAYDAGNRLTVVTDGGGAITRGFDATDQLLSEASPPRGTVSYTYDNGRRRTMAVTDQPEVCYDYDGAHRLTAIRQGGCGALEAVSLTYDDAGRRALLTLPNGAQQIFGYTPRSLVSSIQYKKSDGSVLGDITYGYDAVGNRSAVGGSWGRTGLPAAVTAASYDDANQLLQWVTAGATATFIHDTNGNIQTVQMNGLGTDTYEWDARNVLRSITDPVTDLAKATFVYDALGRRIERGIHGTTTQFLYDGFTPVGELSLPGVSGAALTTGLGLDEYYTRVPFDVIPLSTLTRHFLTDALGSTVALADADGNVQTQYTYEPFGATTQVPSVSEESNPFQFTGRENDGTGLYYYRARYYNPMWGRFVSEDPSEGERLLAHNLYVYAFNDPLGFTDPTGLVPFDTGVCRYYDQHCNRQGCGGRPVDPYYCRMGNCCRSFGDGPKENCVRECLIRCDKDICAHQPGGGSFGCRSSCHYSCWRRCGFFRVPPSMSCFGIFLP